MPEFFDTHCHIHTAGVKRDDFTVQKWHKAGENDPAALLASANQEGVTRLICVGTDTEDSLAAYTFTASRQHAWTAVGVHPHEAIKTTTDDLQKIRKLIVEDQKKTKSERKIVAIGEVGLDYYYEHSPKAAQVKLLEQFLDMAIHAELPVIFHVREAFDDFWPILAKFKNIRGVLHSFTDTEKTLEKALEAELYIGLNGIMTFTKDEAQLAMAKSVPLDNLLLETDSPYLTPKPFRGKICLPQHVKATAMFLADLREEEVAILADRTTKNARSLFAV